MTESVPAEYEPQPWLKGFSKRELAWLCQQLHDRNTALQIDNRAMRQRLALYESRERQK